jgi:hypothetical protein
MKKIIKLTESELTKLIESMVKQINEEDDKDYEFQTKPGFVERRMKLMQSNQDDKSESLRDMGFSVEPTVKMIPREKEVEGLFGKYKEQVPNDVLRYLRKNPQLIMDRLVRIYGKNFLDYAEKAYTRQMKKDGSYYEDF